MSQATHGQEVEMVTGRRTEYNQRRPGQWWLATLSPGILCPAANSESGLRSSEHILTCEVNSRVKFHASNSIKIHTCRVEFTMKT